MLKRQKFYLPAFFGFLIVLLPLVGCAPHEAKQIAENISDADQPDKILYERSLFEIARNRYDVGRLTLNTLINTYPDSEFLAKAKLAIADSYYEEGGGSGLTQAQVEYRDFITFFPTAPEAPEAQYKIGLSHFRRISKPGRDLSEALLAEAEFKEFLLRYPDSQFMPKAKSKLRQVQELIADRNYNIAMYYAKRRANMAVISRLEDIADDYPSYSKADSALWVLASTLEKLKRNAESVPYYSRIITDYPFSPMGEESKERLKTLGQAVPRPTRAALIRAEADALHKPRRGLFARFGGMMSSKPDLSATRRGPVRVTKANVPNGPLVAKAEKSSAPKKKKRTGGVELTLMPVTTEEASEESLVEGKAPPSRENSVGVSVITDSNSPVQEKEDKKATGNGNGIGD